MKETADNSDELLELLGAAWDGRLEEASFARLEELLAVDRGAACGVLVAFSRLQVELAWQAASSQAHEKALVSLEPFFEKSASSAPAASHSGARVLKSAAGRSKGRNSNRVDSKRRFFVVAAGLLISIAAFMWYSQSTNSHINQTAEQIPLLRAPDMVARFVNATDAVWQDGARHAEGDLLSQGERMQLLRGTAQISMSCGADILLQSPCTVELSSDNRVRLYHGKLTA